MAFAVGSMIGSVAQLLKLKLPGSTRFEGRTLYIQIPMNALEVGNFLFDFGHLLFNQLCTISTIDQLVALRIQNLAYFPQGKSHALRALDKVQILQGLLGIDTIIVGLPQR